MIKILSVLVVVATLIGVSGCGDDRRSILPTKFEGIAGEPVSILVDFGTHSKSRFDLHVEVATSVAACMRNRGYEYIDPTFVTGMDISSGTVGDLWKRANRTGYLQSNANVGRASTRSADPNRDYAARLGSDEARKYWRALTGADDLNTSDAVEIPRYVPPRGNGCLASSTREILQDLPAFAPGVGDQLSKIGADEFKQPTLRAAINNWIECVRGNGLEADHYDALLEQVASELDDPGRDANRQRDAAKVDVGCYLETLHMARREYEMAALSDLAGRFPEYRAEIAETASR